MKVAIEMEIDEQRIQDLLICALEGGSNYWYEIRSYNYPEGETKQSLGIEFPHVQLPFHGGSLTIVDKETGDECGVLDRDACVRGLQVMSRDHPKCWADFIEENEDACTGDVFLQCALFGEVV